MLLKKNSQRIFACASNVIKNTFLNYQERQSADKLGIGISPSIAKERVFWTPFYTFQDAISLLSTASHCRCSLFYLAKSCYRILPGCPTPVLFLFPSKRYAIYLVGECCS